MSVILWLANFMTGRNGSTHTPEKTTVLSKWTDKRSHRKLYRVHLATCANQIINLSRDQHWLHW